VERKNTPNVFVICSINPTDSDRIWYMLSWVNSSYRNVNVFHLTWIMSLHYLVKLSIRSDTRTAFHTAYWEKERSTGDSQYRSTNLHREYRCSHAWVVID